MERHTVRYRGNVQGVGFRYTAQQAARAYDLTGFVRNLPNGDVELTVEGNTYAVEGYLRDLASRMHGYIREAEVRQEEPTGEFTSFEIRYG